MRKFINLVALAAMLFVPWLAQAQTTTTIVADGGATNNYIPIYGYWSDAPQHNQIIYPADMLVDIPGVTISGMKFYATSSPSWGNTATVSMAIVDSPTLTGLNSTATLTQVWSGTVSFSSNEWSITFDTPFTYTSGNLLVDIVTTAGSYSAGTFNGMGTSYAASYYHYTSSYSDYGETQNFIPKTEFTHTIPVLSCYRPYDVVASNITNDGATLSWTDTLNSGATYSIDYWVDGGDTNTVTSTTASYTFSGLEANTFYHYAVKSVCSASDESFPTSGSFKTDCLNGSCEITVASTSGYMATNYCPTLDVYQNGALVTSVNAATEQVNVCSGDTVIVLYTAPTYTWYSPTATILDGGGVELFNGSTSTYSSGDTLSVVAVPCPSCLPPVALTAIPDSNQIEFSWNPRSGAGQFVVYLNDSIVSNSVTDTFYTFTDLPANTAFTVRVQSVCTGDDSSSIASINTRTACGQITLPYFVDFEDAEFNGAWYPCWDSVIHAGTDPSVNSTAAYNSTRGMYFQATPSEAYNLVVSPLVPTAGNNIYVRFWGYNTNTTWFKAGVISNPNDTSTFIPLVDIVGNSWHEYEFRTDTATAIDPTETYYIAWMAYKPGVTYNTQMGRVDDVLISEIPSCQRVTSTYTNNVTAHTVDLGWSAMGSGSYKIYYGTVNNINDPSIQTILVNDTVYTLTGLNGETHYYAWVATVCSGTEAEANSFNSFTTLISCPAVTGLTVDTTTTDGATISWNAGGVETMWEVVLDSNEAEVIYDSSYTITGLDAMTGHTLYVRGICGDGDTAAVRSISFATLCEDAVCNITIHAEDSYGDGWNGATIQVYQAGVMIDSYSMPGQGVSNTRIYDTANIEVCSSAAVSLYYVRGSYDSELAGDVTDGGGNVIFTISSMGSHSTGELLATSSTPCPDCVPPTNLTVDAITATSATISWTPQEGQSSWIVKLDTNEAVTVNDNYYTFNDLDARSSHTAYVATDCDGDTSNFISVNFLTDCATGSCDITVSATCTYSYGGGYAPSVSIYQNGVEVTTVNNETRTVNVCAGVPTTFLYVEPEWDYFTCNVVITDGGGDEVFNAMTSDDGNTLFNTGDTLAILENACPTCLKPTGLMASAIDSNMLSFYWDWADTVTSYVVSFDGGAWTPVTTLPYTQSGLLANTAYTLSVKVVCTPGDTSNASSITVKTACGSMVIPYTADFESDATGNMPSCWTLVTPTHTYGNYPGVSTSGRSTGHALTMAADYNDSTTVATSLVPLAGNEILVSFWASVNQGNTLYAGVMTDLAVDSTFIPLMTVPYNNSTYTLYEFNTSTLPSYEQYYVAFRLVTGGSNHYADIDDVNIRVDAGCMTPTNLRGTTTAHTIDLAWTNNSTVSNFVVMYKPAGGTWSSDPAIDTTHTLNGLLAATNYDVRVGLICTPGDTLWTSTITLQTLCDLMPLPYSENFDAYANDVMPPCWEWNTSFCTHWDGGLFFRSYHGGGSEYAVLPQLDGNIAKLKIEFDTKVGTIAEGDGILIGVADAAGTLLAWLDTLQDPLFSRNAHVHKTVYFTNYINIMPGAAARVAFAQYKNWGEWALIDNINIEELPDCYPVDNLIGHNLDDIENTTFSWTPQGLANQWQVYVDTMTVSIDSLANIPDSLFITVSDTFYTLPIGMVQGGGIYNFFVRSACSDGESGWVSNTFGAGTIIMNNSTVADTVTGCGFVVYDNGGPIPGYLPNSNSALVLRTENAGSQLKVFGGKFGFGSSPTTLNIYDGENAADSMLLYTYNTVDGRDTLLDTILAVSTTGSLTITFSVSGSMCHTGYELYIRCTDGAICPRPTELQAEMTSATTADVTWTGSAPSYHFYYRLNGATTWSQQTVTTNNVTLYGLLADTTYDMYVVALCSATDSSTASLTRQLFSHYEEPVLPTQFTVTLLSADATMGTVSPAGATVVDSATTFTATATATSGYHFVAWMDGTTPASTTNPYSFVVTANITLTAAFAQDVPDTVYYTITTAVNDPAMGTVTGGGTYAEGSVITLTASANDGYHFVNWNDDVTTASRTITVTADATYTANFAQDDPEETYYNITVTANDPAMGTVTGGGRYLEGSVITLTASANDGYHFVNWNDDVTTASRTITVTADATYTAFFEQNVGIEDVDATAITLFPNPATTTVTLTGLEGVSTVTLVDLNGRENGKWNVENGELTIDVSDMAKGAYFVRITGERTNVIRKLIVR